jgi:hypothetical protein
MKDMGGSAGTVPCILNNGIRLRLVECQTLAFIYSLYTSESSNWKAELDSPKNTMLFLCASFSPRKTV